MPRFFEILHDIKRPCQVLYSAYHVTGVLNSLQTLRDTAPQDLYKVELNQHSYSIAIGTEPALPSNQRASRSLPIRQDALLWTLRWQPSSANLRARIPLIQLKYLAWHVHKQRRLPVKLTGKRKVSPRYKLTWIKSAPLSQDACTV